MILEIMLEIWLLFHSKYGQISLSLSTIFYACFELFNILSFRRLTWIQCTEQTIRESNARCYAGALHTKFNKIHIKKSLICSACEANWCRYFSFFWYFKAVEDSILCLTTLPRNTWFRIHSIKKKINLRIWGETFTLT